MFAPVVVNRWFILVLSLSFAHKSQKEFMEKILFLKSFFTVLTNFLSLDLFRFGMFSMFS